MADRLAELAARSEDADILLVEMVYQKKYVQFDISAMELKYLPMADIIDRYFKKAFADVQVTTADSETLLAASSLTSPV